MKKRNIRAESYYIEVPNPDSSRPTKFAFKQSYLKNYFINRNEAILIKIINMNKENDEIIIKVSIVKTNSRHMTRQKDPAR